ncbi:MAG: MarR family transcriptional regulator [Candidatus Woesearchaeota archaeon]|nr:MarR family transcriptional regulator [Candidatus Aenigmarchaeota archaeon]MBU5689278.1 MarR family transcriptional regulator [Candidatus Aenigmarchaeota archaeon]
MKNRIVGLIIISIALLIGFIIYAFNRALTEIVNTSCSHGPECPMWGSINFHTNISIGIMIFVLLIGLYLFFFGQDEKIVKEVRVIRKSDKKESKNIPETSFVQQKNLTYEEKFVIEKIIEAEGSILQSELVEKTNYSKVKITRILDKLEAKGLIERKRRGMTNLVVLKKQ